MTYSSMSAVRNSPGASTIVISQFSDVSMAVMINTGSVDTIGDVASDSLGVFLYFWSSAHMQPFTFPHQFYFRNIIARSVSARCC